MNPTSAKHHPFPPDARIIPVDEQPQRYQAVAPAPRPATTRKRRESPALGQAIREIVETILPAVLIALMIHLFLAQATRVEGYSMEPTLHGQERLVIEKLSFHFHPPERGDIVVLRVPEYGKEMLIKRVIGLPGDTIAVENGQVILNGETLVEDYINGPVRGNYGPMVVPPDSVFVMGDNRNNSNDSRAFGPIPYDNIVGRAWIRYWPLQEIDVMN
ncbi:MAG TPA: signal peptidase I [Caldilineae bacterium]|nr:signal peptidase I [Caldilineae bacterium]